VRRLRSCVSTDLPDLRETPQLNFTAFAPQQINAGGAAKNWLLSSLCELAHQVELASEAAERDWRLRKVRSANIPPEIRDELERNEEAVVAAALGREVPVSNPLLERRSACTHGHALCLADSPSAHAGRGLGEWECARYSSFASLSDQS
jgi:hypothetical protein